MNRKVLTILLGIIFGVPLVLAAIFLSNIGAAMKESAAFATTAIPAIAQPWDLSAAIPLFGTTGGMENKELAKTISGASKKFGNLRSFKLGGASPSSTERDGESTMTFSYNAYAICEKGNAVIGIETFKEHDNWRLMNLNVREPATFEAEHFK